MSSKIFFTSDTHFKDIRLIPDKDQKIHPYHRDFENIETHDQHLIERWNYKVGKNDIVYHIGDVTTDVTGLDVLTNLNGVKHLIRGNKDLIFKDEELLVHFESVLNNCEIQLSSGEAVFLTHYPVLGKENLFNLVGHVHKLWMIQPNMLNIGVDVWNWTPVSEEEVIHTIKCIRNLYDKDCFAAYLPANTNKVSGLKNIHTSYLDFINKASNEHLE